MRPSRSTALKCRNRNSPPREHAISHGAWLVVFVSAGIAPPALTNWLLGCWAVGLMGVDGPIGCLIKADGWMEFWAETGSPHGARTARDGDRLRQVTAARNAVRSKAVMAWCSWYHCIRGLDTPDEWRALRYRCVNTRIHEGRDVVCCPNRDAPRDAMRRATMADSRPLSPRAFCERADKRDVAECSGRGGAGRSRARGRTRRLRARILHSCTAA